VADVSLTRRQVLFGAVASAVGGCRASQRVDRVTTPVPASFDLCQAAAPAVLRILTWNIFMMPAWIHESPRNEPRGAAIGATLREQDLDVICLQKAFDRGARDSLARALGGDYAYRYGPINDRTGVEINGGVWVLSRRPLIDYREIEFRDCGSVECFSRKGAMLLSGRCGPTPFRLVVTHLQGEEGPRFTEKNQRVRLDQMRAVQAQLVQPNLEPGVPFLICGDLGTPRFTDDGRTETAAYREMLATFGADNGAEARITLDETPTGSALARSAAGRRNELDYVLVRPNGARVTVQRERVILQRGGWDEPAGGRRDLSYRYAVSARVTFAS
jgi:endonuclease/exonuclease/phosphatase family metal-dependent hydrolase